MGVSFFFSSSFEGFRGASFEGFRGASFEGFSREAPGTFSDLIVMLLSVLGRRG
jgi:hypothetical protein